MALASLLCDGCAQRVQAPLYLYVALLRIILALPSLTGPSAGPGAGPGSGAAGVVDFVGGSAGMGPSSGGVHTFVPAASHAFPTSKLMHV